MQMRLELASQGQTSPCKPSNFCQGGEARARFWFFKVENLNHQDTSKMKQEQLLASPCVIKLVMQFTQSLPTNRVMPQMRLV